MSAPGVLFSPSSLSYHNRSTPVTWSIKLEPATADAKLPAGSSVHVTIAHSKGDRTREAKPASNGTFSVEVIPVPDDPPTPVPMIEAWSRPSKVPSSWPPCIEESRWWVHQRQSQPTQMSNRRSTSYAHFPDHQCSAASAHECHASAALAWNPRDGQPGVGHCGRAEKQAPDRSPGPRKRRR